MRRTITRGQVLLIGLLAFLLSTGQPHPVSAGSDVWISIGPGGGSIRALAIDPLTPTRLYAGTAGGGVFAMQQFAFQNRLPLIRRGR